VNQQIHRESERDREWAGFYGYDLIENVRSKAGIHRAESIEQALEHPKTGDVH
jgi:hypothetical protein